MPGMNCCCGSSDQHGIGHQPLKPRGGEKDRSQPRRSRHVSIVSVPIRAVALPNLLTRQLA